MLKLLSRYTTFLFLILHSIVAMRSCESCGRVIDEELVFELHMLRHAVEKLVEKLDELAWEIANAVANR
jgi:hypothetical protein